MTNSDQMSSEPFASASGRDAKVRLFSMVLCLVTIACDPRAPPPGSGALETTPTGSSGGPAPTVASMPAVLAFPNGSVLTTDPKACRVACIRDATTLWERESLGCGGFLEANVAMDSVVYVRTQKELTSYGPDGALRFVTKFAEMPPPRSLAAPTSLADSRVAVATSAKTLVVYERDGNLAWSFSPPSDEVLIAPPVGMKTEGIVLMTSQNVYYLGATGETRFRAPIASQLPH